MRYEPYGVSHLRNDTGDADTGKHKQADRRRAKVHTSAVQGLTRLLRQAHALGRLWRRAGFGTHYRNTGVSHDAFALHDLQASNTEGVRRPQTPNTPHALRSFAAYAVSLIPLGGSDQLSLSALRLRHGYSPSDRRGQRGRKRRSEDWRTGVDAGQPNQWRSARAGFDPGGLWSRSPAYLVSCQTHTLLSESPKVQVRPPFWGSQRPGFPRKGIFRPFRSSKGVLAHG